MDNFSQLFSKMISGNLDREEMDHILHQLDQHDNPWLEHIDMLLHDTKFSGTGTDEQKERLYLQLTQKRHQKRRVVFMALQRVKWVAAAVVILIAGAVLWYNVENRQQQLSVSKNAFILPGFTRATLQLSDGRQIVLDSTLENIIDSDGLIVKNDKEGLRYGGTNERVEYHTLSTPRGGQYKLELSDGTNIWLNAASSITYPNVFNGGKRKVHITGEAYFEVAKDKEHPFEVSTDKMEIIVMGTHFNINTYHDEPYAAATLTEGSIKVKTAAEESVLVPGQQARLGADKKINVANVNTSDFTGWKNGLIVFDNADLGTIMRQVSRWYNIDVVFEGRIPEGRFVGGISRKSSLQDLVKVLSFEQVNILIDGNKLIVKP